MHTKRSINLLSIGTAGARRGGSRHNGFQSLLPLTCALRVAVGRRRRRRRRCIVLLIVWRRRASVCVFVNMVIQCQKRNETNDASAWRATIHMIYGNNMIALKIQM